MIQRLQDYRVYIIHGTLLLAVLVVVYFSAQAQYSALVDQQLDETRSQQQAAVRSAAQVLEQNLRSLASNPETTLEELPDALRPRARLTVDRSTARVIVSPSTINPEALEPIIERLPALLRVGTPTLVLERTRDKADIILLAQTPDQQRLCLLMFSSEQLISLTMSATAQSRDLRVLIGDADGTVIAASGADRPATLEEAIPSPELVQTLRTAVNANSVAPAIVDLPRPHGLSVLTLQPLTPVPESRWFVLFWRDRQQEELARTLEPLVWQLLTGAGLVVLAVAIVLVSTTISIFASRRRMEQMRLEMLNRDLQKARRIQLNWLPTPHERRNGVDIAAENQPAAHISGDFYNWFDLPADRDNGPRTVIVLGDVSGHGLPAAFLMATTQLLVKNAMPRLHDPGACLTEINHQICSLVYGGQFVSMLILVIDHANHAIRIASAGQAPPLLKRGQHVEQMDVDPDLVVGVEESTTYPTHQIEVQAGDLLFFYTDGVIETTDRAAQQFGIERLHDALAEAPDDPEPLIHSILGAIAAHRQGHDAEDDLTMVAVRLTPLVPDAAHAPSEAAMV